MPTYQSSTRTDQSAYTVERGMGVWIVRRPDGQSIRSVETRSFALELAAHYTANGEGGISGSR